MYEIYQTQTFAKVVKKFFKKHKNLISTFIKVNEQLEQNPFHNSLKTHKLNGNLSEFYACSLTFEYRIVMIIEIKDEEITLINIGSHDEVYKKG